MVSGRNDRCGLGHGGILSLDELQLLAVRLPATDVATYRDNAKELLAVQMDMRTMMIHFLGAARTTTGSMHMLETNAKRLLLDCGLYQGKRKGDRQ